MCETMNKTREIAPVTDQLGNYIKNQDGNFLYFNTATGEILAVESEAEGTIEEKSYMECSDGIWTDNETLALISVYEKFKDHFTNVRKRKNVWNEISIELNTLNIYRTALKCERKWLNLLRTYKIIKDACLKSGRGTPKKFKYYDRIDEIVGNRPSNKIHEATSTFDVGIERVERKNKPLTLTNVSQNDQSSSGGDLLESTPSTSSSNTLTPLSKKRKYSIGNQDYFKYKKEYMAEKLKKWKEQQVAKERLQKEKIELEKKRLDLEERKVIALEKLANNHQ